MENSKKQTTIETIQNNRYKKMRLLEKITTM